MEILKAQKAIKAFFSDSQLSLKGYTADQQWQLGSHAAVCDKQTLDHVISAFHRAEVRCSFITTTVREESQVTPQRCLSHQMDHLLL